MASNPQAIPTANMPVNAAPQIAPAAAKGVAGYGGMDHQVAGPSAMKAPQAPHAVGGIVPWWQRAQVPFAGLRRGIWSFGFMPEQGFGGS
jgi:hypothetical protein